MSTPTTNADLITRIAELEAWKARLRAKIPVSCVTAVGRAISESFEPAPKEPQFEPAPKEPQVEAWKFEAWKEAQREANRAESKNKPITMMNVMDKALLAKLEALRTEYHKYIKETNLNYADLCQKFYTLRSENEELRAELATEKANKRPIDEKLDAY